MYSRWIKNNLISINVVKDVDYSHAFKHIGNYSNEEISNMSTNKRSKEISFKFLSLLEL